jgi:hypothetical protein
MRLQSVSFKTLLVCSIFCAGIFLIAASQEHAELPKLIYGQQYHLLNGYNNWSGGFLDTDNVCNTRWPAADLCVSTAQSPDRAGMHTAT